MRELYNELFHIPKHGRIREKVMMARIITAITIVIMCLAAMGITAYAYFSCSISSDSNMIKAAHFVAKVSVQNADDQGEIKEIKTINGNSQNHKIALNAGELYTVTITPTENSTAKTGYVVVSADGCDETYDTQQLGIDLNADEGKRKSISFKIMATDKTNVRFLARWGTSSYYDAYINRDEDHELYITEGEQIKLIVNGMENPVVPHKDEGVVENTEGEESGDSEGSEPQESISEETSQADQAPPSATINPSDTTTAEPEISEPETLEDSSESVDATEEINPIDEELDEFSE